ncbi:MAG: hypothetical protein AAGC55_28835, partial [Myxococcota bacterium]
LGLLAHPTALDGRLVLGSALIALRRYDEVLAEMRVALEIEGANAWALALKGEALLYKGDAFQAVQVLRQAQSHAPGEEYISNLCLQAEEKLAMTGTVQKLPPSGGASSTRGYPLYTAEGELVTSSQSEVIGFDVPAHSPPPEVLAIGDHSRSIELDPRMDSGVLYGDDPPIEPPGFGARGGFNEGSGHAGFGAEGPLGSAELPTSAQRPLATPRPGQVGGRDPGGWGEDIPTRSPGPLQSSMALNSDAAQFGDPVGAPFHGFDDDDDEATSIPTSALPAYRDPVPPGHGGPAAPGLPPTSPMSPMREGPLPTASVLPSASTTEPQEQFHHTLPPTMEHFALNTGSSRTPDPHALFDDAAGPHSPSNRAEFRRDSSMVPTQALFVDGQQRQPSEYNLDDDSGLIEVASQYEDSSYYDNRDDDYDDDYDDDDYYFEDEDDNDSYYLDEAGVEY